MTYQNVPTVCEACGGNHVVGNCPQPNVGEEEVQYMEVLGRQVGQPGNYPNSPPTSWRNNMNQNWGWKQDAGNEGRQPMYQQQPQKKYPSLQDRTSKLEDTLEKFMQATMTHQKNQEASMRNLETQVGQLAKQMADQQGRQFLANTQTNPKEQCKAITIRCGKQVSSDVTAIAADNQRKTVEVENVVEAREDRSKERVESETVAVEEFVDVESMKANEKLVDGSGKK